MPPGALLLPRGFAAPGTMPIWVATVATWDHGDILDLAAAGIISGSMDEPQLGSMLMSLTHVAFNGQEDAPGLDHCLCLVGAATWTKSDWLTSTVNCGHGIFQTRALSRGHVWVSDPDIARVDVCSS